MDIWAFLNFLEIAEEKESSEILEILESPLAVEKKTLLLMTLGWSQEPHDDFMDKTILWISGRFRSRKTLF